MQKLTVKTLCTSSPFELQQSAIRAYVAALPALSSIEFPRPCSTAAGTQAVVTEERRNAILRTLIDSAFADARLARRAILARVDYFLRRERFAWNGVKQAAGRQLATVLALVAR